MSSSAEGARSARSAHFWYVVSLLFKGGIGAAQMAAGLGLALVPTASIQAYVISLAKIELIQDPDDPAAQWVQQAMNAIPGSSVNFYVVYLIIHGVLNLGLVMALVARFHWAYPAAIVALVAFVAYQTYDYFMGKGLMMVVLSVIDIVVIWLIWREWMTQSLRWRR